MDPLEGGGQLIADVIPKQASRYLTNLTTRLPTRPECCVIPEGGKDQQMAERERRDPETTWRQPEYRLGANGGGHAQPSQLHRHRCCQRGYQRRRRADVGCARPHVRYRGWCGIGSFATGFHAAHYAKKKLDEIGLRIDRRGFWCCRRGDWAGLHGLGSWVARNYPENLTSQPGQDPDRIRRTKKRVLRPRTQSTSSKPPRKRARGGKLLGTSLWRWRMLAVKTCRDWQAMWLGSRASRARSLRYS